MSLEAFLHNLHYDIEKTKPPEAVVDWEDGPLAYKLYRGLPVVPLSPAVPLTLVDGEASEKPDLHRMGHFLWYIYGLTGLSQSVPVSNLMMQNDGLLQLYRRFVPSGEHCTRAKYTCI